MGRRKRSHSDDYDDSIERKFLQKQTSSSNENSKATNNDPRAKLDKEEKDQAITASELENSKNSASFGNDSEDHRNLKDDIDRLREKKRAKKQRQKEKKLAEKKRAQEQEAARRQNQEKLEQIRQEEKKRKEIGKKVPTSDNFIQTHKGVKYCDIQVGHGPIIQDRKKVRVKYTLRANNKNGKILDSSGNFSFKMGKGEVISGWEIGLLRMRQGGVRHIIVPPKAGYGSKDIGGGSGADLYFEVTLLQC
jgi:FKBP-type peptidyl-prolyl cis-trans isomerase